MINDVIYDIIITSFSLMSQNRVVFIRLCSLACVCYPQYYYSLQLTKMVVMMTSLDQNLTSVNFKKYINSIYKIYLNHKQNLGIVF